MKLSSGLTQSLAEYACVGIAVISPEADSSQFRPPIRIVEDAGTLYRLDFSPEATPTQQDAAIAAFLAYSPPAQPLWNEFLDALPQNILAKIAASPLAALIVARVSRLADKSIEWQGESDRLLTAWNAAPPGLTGEERAALNALAESKKLPVRIDNSNSLSLA